MSFIGKFSKLISTFLKVTGSRKANQLSTLITNSIDNEANNRPTAMELFELLEKAESAKVDKDEVIDDLRLENRELRLIIEQQRKEIEKLKNLAPN